jgi:RNA polymerase II subunit A C-terminal domain phosphatase
MLRISEREASRREEEAKRRLLAARKLSLVVDLDQTIIHAAVDPTIAEWQKDKDNPNYEAVKDVRAFQLIDDGPGMRGCWYYIKLRPGLEEFLELISQTYELHIYTMGTRQYAEQIANIVDPERNYFGDRILSRDESGSMTNKNLERLFPIDTKMVVIIDDRGDVWKWNANLVRVIPFDFFVGIGDINSSFLPKKQEIKPTPKASEKTEDAKPEGTSANGQDHSKADPKMQDGAETETAGATNGNDESALEQLVAMGGGDDPVMREIQSKGQEETIAAQVEEKPLFQMQKLLDAKDQAEADAAAAAAAEDNTVNKTMPNGGSQHSKPESEASTSSSEAEPTPSPPPKPAPTRHSLLRDDDRELFSLSTRLKAVHTAFYNEYDRKRLSLKGGRVAALSGKGRKMQLQPDISTSSEDASDLLLVPDIKSVMPEMKNRVLSGVVICFSGVLPLETDVQIADISLWAKTFGATIAEKVGRKVTHVVAARPGTSKVKQGVRRGLWVVSTQWLIDCMTGWKRVREDNYVLQDMPGAAKTKASEGSPDRSGSSDDRKELLDDNRGFLISSDEAEGETTGLDTEAETEDHRKAGKDAPPDSSKPDRKRLKLDTNKPPTTAADDDAATTDTDDPTISFMEDASPLSINQDEWADMDKELREFIGSDVESDDSGVEFVGPSTRNIHKRKRMDDGEDSDNAGRRRRVGGGARVSDSALKEVDTASPIPSISVSVHGAGMDRHFAGGGLPNGDEAAAAMDMRGEQRGVESEGMRDGEEELSDDDEWARELEREFEDSSGEEEGGKGGVEGVGTDDRVKLGLDGDGGGDDEVSGEGDTDRKDIAL